MISLITLPYFSYNQILTETRVSNKLCNKLKSLFIKDGIL